jgi:hypothetical protein
MILQERASEVGQWIEHTVDVRPDARHHAAARAAQRRSEMTLAARTAVENRAEAVIDCFNGSELRPAGGEGRGLRRGQVAQRVPEDRWRRW